MNFKSDKLSSSLSPKEWIASAMRSDEDDIKPDFNSEESLVSNSNDSLILSTCTIRGAFNCEGDLRIDGFLEGDLVVTGSLVVGESAMIRANVRAKSLVSFGKIIGDVICSDRVELQVGAQLRGNLKTRKLLIQDGVIFDGSCEMTSKSNKLDDQSLPKNIRQADLLKDS